MSQKNALRTHKTVTVLDSFQDWKESITKAMLRLSKDYDWGSPILNQQIKPFRLLYLNTGS